MASLSNTRWVNRRARLKRLINNEDMAEIAKLPVSDDVT